MQFRTAADDEAAVSAPSTFRFKRPSAEIDWKRIEAIDVDLIRARGHSAALQKHLGVVAMGKVDEETSSSLDPRALHAYHVLQLQLQYLLFSHQALRDKAFESEKKLASMKRHEVKARRRSELRKERVRSLVAETANQEEVQRSKHVLLFFGCLSYGFSPI